MKLLSCGALLLFAATAVAQQQAQPPYNPPPYSTPPTLPQDQTPTEPMPPDTKAPSYLSSAEVQEQIQKKLASEPLLANADVNATADDNSVVLAGTVENEQERELALRIAESYAGERKIIDKLEIRQGT